MTEVISVRFRGGCKTYYFDPRGVQVTAGEHVIVEMAQGLEYAQCAEGNHEVPDEQVVEPFRPMVRIATDHDRRVLERNRAREKEAFDVCQKKILQHKLEMKLVRVECSFDGNKILFFFTADGRVDFRELVKDLASAFRARIELRQIGVRDEAKMLGGLGICGRPFCCAQFLDDFMPVSIKMAKTQSLSLNPTKISGTCGRLMCCLKYEQEAYEDALKRLPKNDSFVQTPDGPGNVSDVNVLKETVKVRLDEKPEAPRCYHNCEVCVLRNGKGSREGIEIPKERPARYTEERQEEFPVRHHCRLCRRPGGAGGGPPPQPPPQRRQGQRASCGASGGKAGGEAAGGQSPPPYPQRQARHQRHQALHPPAGCQARVPSGEPAAHRGRRAKQQAPPAPWRPPQRRSGRRYAQDGGVSRGKVFRRSDRQRL